ncbi:MAG: AbrB/MazE/SpoVT family DNA-binding domain-containing protein [Rhizomicrobium sp.]
MVMKVELVRIGNSRGIRIPKAVLEQCGLRKTAELRIENDTLVIAPERRPRAGREEAFRAAEPSSHDDLLLDSVPANEFDREEWRW